MRPKPDHWTAENAARFQHPSVVDRYPLRAPYPQELFDVLASLIHDTPRVVLDVGTGTGDLARPLAARADLARVDALDPSATMLAKARGLPGGDSPRLRWIAGTAEDAPLDPPYALVTAGESLHWMDWDRVLPRFRAAGTPNSVLAICYRLDQREPWHDELVPIIQRYSTMRKFEEFVMTDELAARGLFERLGQHETPPRPFAQPIEDYIAGFHSRSSLSLAALTPEDAAAFDDAVRALVAPRFPDGLVRFEVAAGVVWGRAL
ncbi:MAG TPA: methyltransferase domain-containing protein [Ktedonobacterales bacterium]